MWAWQLHEPPAQAVPSCRLHLGAPWWGPQGHLVVRGIILPLLPVSIKEPGGWCGPWLTPPSPLGPSLSILGVIVRFLSTLSQRGPGVLLGWTCQPVPCSVPSHLLHVSEALLKALVWGWQSGGLSDRSLQRACRQERPGTADGRGLTGEPARGRPRASGHSDHHRPHL